MVELLVRFHCSQNWEKSIHEGVPMRKVDTEEFHIAYKQTIKHSAKYWSNPGAISNSLE